MSDDHALTRVWIDDASLAEDLGLDPDGDRMLYTVDDEEMDSAIFTAWLREKGLSENDLKWTEGSGLNISGQEYAHLGDAEEEDEEADK